MSEAELSWEDDEDRWIDRRRQYLEADYDLREPVAEALAYSELGYFNGGISKKTGTSASTVKKYKERLLDRFGPGPLSETPPAPAHPEVDLNTSMHDLRTCPSCDASSIVSVREAKAAFPSPSDGLSSAIRSAESGEATHVCTSCHKTQKLGAATDSTSYTPSGLYENVPEAMREHDRWVCWREEDRNGKPTKVPIAPWATDGVRSIDKGNPHVWATFRKASNFADKTPGWGLGFVFDRSGPLVGVDLDDCIVDDELTETAAEIVDRFDAYTELSPSGTGLHIIAEGELPPDVANKNDSAGVEIYDRDRFFTVTGRVYSDGPVADRSGAVEWVESEFLEERDISLSESEELAHEPSSPLYGISVADVYPELPVGVNCEHPEHGSSTGSNFKITEGGETAVCWHGPHAVGQGDGCGLSAVHLLAMQALGLEECDEVRERWREDDEMVFETWKYAIEEYDLPPEPAPSRALSHLAAEMGLDVGADDVKDRKNAYRTARLAAKHNYDIDIDPNH